MSYDTDRFRQTPGNWRSRYGAYNNIDTGRMPLMFPPSFGLRPTLSGSGTAQGFWRHYEGRVIAGPIGLVSFAGPPDINHITIRTTHEPSLLHQRIMQAPLQAEASRLTQDEQAKNSRMPKREIYNPVLKRLGKRVNLYYRDNNYNEKDMEEDEDGKACAICLEDFEPREVVMRTPCSHMFHEECIGQWLNSQKKCPVCRSEIYE